LKRELRCCHPKPFDGGLAGLRLEAAELLNLLRSGLSAIWYASAASNCAPTVRYCMEKEAYVVGTNLIAPFV
jgi:hypothetical protein